MLKFYYNHAPNPLKVALFLEESVKHRQHRIDCMDEVARCSINVTFAILGKPRSDSLVIISHHCMPVLQPQGVSEVVIDKHKASSMLERLCCW